MEFSINNIMDIRDIFVNYISEHLKDIDKGEDEFEIYKKLLIKYECDNEQFAFQNKHMIRECVKNRLLQFNNDAGTLKIKHIRKIIKQLKLETGIYNYNYKIHIDILEGICNILSNNIRFKGSQEDIKQILEYGVELYYCKDEESSFKIKDYEIDSIIKSASYLRRKGYELTISNGEINFAEEIHNKIHNDIEYLICEIDAEQVARYILDTELKKYWDNEYERYFIGRKKSTLIKEELSGYIPYNYLLQICLKNIKKKHPVKSLLLDGKLMKYLEIKKLSTSYMTCLNLQSHSVFEDIVVDNLELPKIISNNILFDKLVCINQWKPKYVIEIIQGIFQEVYASYRQWSYKFKDYLNVAKIVLFNYENCSYIEFEDIFKKLSIKKAVLKDILDDISHINVNEGFTNIYKELNFEQKPLIKISEDRYFLLSPIICCFSFYEVLYQKFKKAGGTDKFDRKLGFIIEKFIKRRLDKHNYKYTSGKYDFNCCSGINRENECDLVLEDDNKILFIEIKKRPLFMGKDEFNDADIWQSLGYGVIYSQRQAFEHKLQLDINEKIIFKDLQNKSNNILAKGNRRVYGISLMFKEYGIISYKLLINNIMKSLTICEYNTVNTSEDYKLNKLRKQQTKLNEVIDIVKQNYQHKVDLKNLFFNFTVRTLQQLLYSIDKSKNVTELINNLICDIYISKGTNDFYNELLNL